MLFRSPVIYKFKTVNKLYFVKRHSLKLNKGRLSTSRLTRKSIASSSSRKSSSKLKLDDNLLSILEGESLLEDGGAPSNLPFSSRSNFISLLDEIEPINNNIDAATKLIDTRRDFTKPFEPVDLQNEIWYKVNVLFRLYKHKGNLEREHLDNKVKIGRAHV